MTFEELYQSLKKLEELGVNLNKPANIATENGVKKVKSIFTNVNGEPFMDIRK